MRYVASNLVCLAALSGMAGLAMSPSAHAGIAYATQTDRVIRFDTASPSTTFAVVATSSAAFGSFPQGIELGLDGQLYVAQSATGAFFRVNPTSGAITTLATLTRPAGTTSSWFFQDLALDPNTGQMLALYSNPSAQNHRLLSINTATSVTTDLGTITGLPASSAFADGLAIGSDGTRYFTWRGNGSVYTLGNAGLLAATRIGTVSATSSTANGLGIDRTAFADPAGDVWYGATESGVQRINADGSPGPLVWNGGRCWDVTFSPVPAPAGASALMLAICGGALRRQQRPHAGEARQGADLASKRRTRSSL